MDWYKFGMCIIDLKALKEDTDPSNAKCTFDDVSDDICSIQQGFVIMLRKRKHIGRKMTSGDEDSETWGIAERGKKSDMSATFPDTPLLDPSPDNPRK